MFRSARNSSHVRTNIVLHFIAKINQGFLSPLLPRTTGLAEYVKCGDSRRKHAAFLVVPFQAHKPALSSARQGMLSSPRCVTLPAGVWWPQTQPQMPNPNRLHDVNGKPISFFLDSGQPEITLRTFSCSKRIEYLYLMRNRLDALNGGTTKTNTVGKLCLDNQTLAAFQRKPRGGCLNMRGISPTPSRKIQPVVFGHSHCSSCKTSETKKKQVWEYPVVIG